MFSKDQEKLQMTLNVSLEVGNESSPLFTFLVNRQNLPVLRINIFAKDQTIIGT